MVHEFVRIRGEFEFERIRANSNLHPYVLVPVLLAGLEIIYFMRHKWKSLATRVY